MWMLHVCGYVGINQQSYQDHTLLALFFTEDYVLRYHIHSNTFVIKAGSCGKQLKAVPKCSDPIQC